MPNIGPRQRRRRVIFGFAGAGTAAVLGVALALAGAPAWLRALVFLPLAAGTYGFFQYREKT